MRARLGLALAAVLLGGGLTISASASTTTTDPLSPWPTGHEWPTGLKGPFQPGPIEHVVFHAADGTKLDGAVRRPIVPAGVKVPIVLESSPYFGTADNSVDTYDTATDATYFHPGLFVSRGFAVARFNVRGTGESGGCLELFGKNEQRDQALIVQKLAAMPWSNGRVAMIGISYPGTTPLEAAVEQAPALKTIIPEGPISAAWQGLDATPNGASVTGGSLLAGVYFGIGSAPPVVSNPQMDQTTPAPVLPVERMCPTVLRHLQAALDLGLKADRDGPFWQERDLSRRFGKVRAAVLWGQNYDDDEYFSDDVVWQQFTRAPKRQIASPGLHTTPEAQDPTFVSYALGWLDFWLKGLGPVPAGLGTVRWQSADVIEPTHLMAEVGDSGISGAWHQSAAWPPPESRREALYLSAGTLATSPGKANTPLLALPRPDGITASTFGPGGYTYPKVYLCADTSTPGAASFGRVLSSELVIAGNPVAMLAMDSDQPQGMVTVDLLDVAPEVCSPIPHADTPGATKLITFGAADLRFLHGNFLAQPFATGTTKQVRVDLHSVAQKVPAGHRLVVLVRGQNPVNYMAAGVPANLVLHGDLGVGSSQITLPLYNGTLGGQEPKVRYPARPFLR
ncbi:MAG: uncharacterized protein QOK42_1651 [Frankiaceae bacterium]|nr:uncharacterized protein [Frankiaceae bacterium]